MRQLLVILIFLFLSKNLIGQVGIGNTNPNAQLDVRSSNQAIPAATDGILIPKVDAFPTGVNANQDAMLVYLTNTVGTDTPGFYYYNHATPDWISIGKGAKRIDDLTDGKSDVDGTNDGSSIFLGIGTGINDDSNNRRNIGIGWQSLTTNTIGGDNIALGYNVLSSNTAGYSNIGIGTEALLNNISNGNIGIGFRTLQSNTMGNDNIGIGFVALNNNTTGVNNIAIGSQSLSNNTTGFFNNAFGRYSLQSNTTGAGNVAIGYNALTSNTTGNDNTSVGNLSGINVNGNNNVLLGFEAGSLTASGSSTGNVMIGFRAGKNSNVNNRLFIDNSETISPLIYGEFDNNILRSNGELQVYDPATTGYAFPTTDGTANQILITDGSGQLSFGDASTTVIHSINDLTDGKSDADGTDDGSSIFLGIGAGANDDGTDNRNIGIGRNTLQNNTTGYDNLSVGNLALNLNNTGHDNIALGVASLLNSLTGNYNVGVGSSTLRNNTTGNRNIAMGLSSLYNNIDGVSNISLGTFSLFSNTSGQYNISVGGGSLFENLTGGANIGIGTNSLGLSTSGNSNIGIGGYSGYYNNGNSNIFIGHEAGYNETGSHKLYIENSNANANNALIYGEFDTSLLRFNARTEITNTTDANGTAGSGALEIGNSLRIDGNEIITNSGTVLFLQSDNNSDLEVDGGTLRVDASTNRIGISTINPQTKLHIEGGGDASLAGGGFFIMGATTATNMLMDNNEIMVRNNGVSAPLYLQNDGGDVYVGGALVHSSDARLKKNIENLPYGLKQILRLTPKQYYWKHRGEQQYKSLGLIAQEVQFIIPEIIHQADDEQRTLSVSYTELIPVLINAVKEQQQTIESLETSNAELNERMERLELLILKKQH